jgi:hypothetical protein
LLQQEGGDGVEEENEKEGIGRGKRRRKGRR